MELNKDFKEFIELLNEHEVCSKGEDRGRSIAGFGGCRTIEKNQGEKGKEVNYLPHIKTLVEKAQCYYPHWITFSERSTTDLCCIRQAEIAAAKAHFYPG